MEQRVAKAYILFIFRVSQNLMINLMLHSLLLLVVYHLIAYRPHITFYGITLYYPSVNAEHVLHHVLYVHSQVPAL